MSRTKSSRVSAAAMPLRRRPAADSQGLEQLAPSRIFPFLHVPRCLRFIAFHFTFEGHACFSGSVGAVLLAETTVKIVVH